MEKKLCVAERAMVGIMVGVTRRDRMTNSDLREKTAVAYKAYSTRHAAQDMQLYSNLLYYHMYR